LVAEAVGGIFVFLFNRFRLHFSCDDYAGILLGLQVAVIYGRDHEILLRAPMAAAFWPYLRHKPAIWPEVAIVLFLIALPERVVGLLGIDILMHWRTATLLFCFVTLLWISFREHSAECQVKTG
jgi:hypothetical protein